MIESGYYPPGAEFDVNAPYNQAEIPEKDFDVTISQTLSKDTTVTTNDYIPGESGVDYEPDGEGGYCACGWQDDDDTSDTNWSNEYEANGYHTPLQLIQMLKDYLQKDLEKWQEEDKKTSNSGPAFHVRRLQHLIEECDGFDEDEIEYVVE